MAEKELLDIIRKIVLQETLYLRVYRGQVKNFLDPMRKGRMLIVVPDLGIVGPEVGFWCYPSDKNSLTSLKFNDWTNVYFMNGDKDQPRYFGKANDMTDMLPKNYDKRSTSHIIFESPDDKIHISFDELSNSMEIGNTGMLDAARKTDATLNTFDAVSNNTAWHTWFVALNGLAPGYPGVAGSTTMDGAITGGSDQVKIGDK